MLDELVAELAKARAERDRARFSFDAVNEEIYDTYGDRLKVTQDAYVAAKQRVEMLETNARTVAVSEFQRTGSKKPHKALSVGEYEIMQYGEDDALEYCVEHEIVAAMKLNKKKFEAVAKVLRPDFVTFDTEARGRIATNLEEWR